jgi:hypothetical protein
MSAQAAFCCRFHFRYSFFAAPLKAPLLRCQSFSVTDAAVELEVPEGFADAFLKAGRPP